jgi:hypothetical protein
VTSTDRQIGDFNFPTSVTGYDGFFVDLPGRPSEAGMTDAIGIQPRRREPYPSARGTGLNRTSARLFEAALASRRPWLAFEPTYWPADKAFSSPTVGTDAAPTLVVEFIQPYFSVTAFLAVYNLVAVEASGA